jgi:hypothetical protein
VRLSYGFVKGCSFAHSAVYAGLLVAWAIPGAQLFETVFGFSHGIGWFAMVGLSIAGLKLRVLPFWLAFLVAVGGAVGPFIGSGAFIWRDRRGGRPAAAPSAT